MKTEFDAFAKTYRETHTINLSVTGENSHYFACYKAKKLKLWAPSYLKNTPEKILDFGCGDGLMTEEVRLQFPKSKIYGIDPSKESITYAKTNHTSINFKISNKKINIFPHAHFDLIYAAAVFHHIPFHEHNYYIKELMKILKPNGLLVIFEHNPFNPGTRYLFNTCPLDINATMMSPRYTKKLVSSYGKIVTKFYAFFPRFLKFLQPVESFFEWCPLGGLYTVILQKK
jgi:ubiquinone/menaquinone biosynthesis C-methylase UbiE